MYILHTILYTYVCLLKLYMTRTTLSLYHSDHRIAVNIVCDIKRVVYSSVHSIQSQKEVTFGIAEQNTSSNVPLYKACQDEDCMYNLLSNTNL